MKKTSTSSECDSRTSPTAGEGEKAQDLQRRLARLQKVLSVATVINSTLDLDKLLGIVMDTAKEVMNAAASSLMLTEEETGDLVFEVATGEVGQQIKEKYRIRKGKGIAGWVAEHMQPLLIEDAYDDERFNPDFDKETGFRTTSMICIPLMTKGELIGVSTVLNKLDEAGGTRGVFNQEDVDIFTLLGNQVTVALENAKLHATILARQRLERDMHLAKTIQQSFLPHSFPKVPGFRLGARNIAALNIGGDIYDFFMLKKDRLAVILGDVSGKGVSAALYSARLISDMRHMATALVEPSKVMRQVNNLLVQRSTRGMFVTLLYLVFDLNDRSFSFANGGHHPILRKSNEGSIEYLNAPSGSPLGIVENMEFPTTSVPMNEGDMILLYTDGILEAFSNSNEMFGYERMEKVVARPFSSLDTMLERLVDSVRAFAGSEKMLDDITAVAVQARKGDK
jgi:phosphoserine phosphatase RsbU/P